MDKKLKEIPIVGKIFDKIANASRPSPRTTASGVNGYRVSKGDKAIAGITNQRGGPDFMVPVTINEVDLDIVEGEVYISAKDENGTIFPVDRNKIYDPETTKANVRALPPSYSEDFGLRRE